MAVSTLMIALSLIRAFDVLFYPNIAYMIITCAIFAFGLAGIYITTKRRNRAFHNEKIEYYAGQSLVGAFLGYFSDGPALNVGSSLCIRLLPGIANFYSNFGSLTVDISARLLSSISNYRR